MPTFSHLDPRGRAHMVDVGDKPGTRREAVALAEIRLRPEVLEALLQGRVPKGDVLATARIAGIQAAKRTAELIPLCHPLPLDSVEVGFRAEPGVLRLRAIARCEGKTGVEMEALTAASVAALTVYDMCKSADREMVLGPVLLAAKSGGRSGTWTRLDLPPQSWEGEWM